MILHFNCTDSEFKKTTTMKIYHRQPKDIIYATFTKGELKESLSLIETTLGETADMIKSLQLGEVLESKPGVSLNSDKPRTMIHLRERRNGRNGRMKRFYITGTTPIAVASAIDKEINKMSTFEDSYKKKYAL